MSLQGALVRDVASDPVGRVLDVLLDPESHDPRWLRVAVGADGDRAVTHEVLVPAAAASEVAPGELIVPYPAATIAAAEHDRDFVSAADAERLRALYGLDG